MGATGLRLETKWSAALDPPVESGIVTAEPEDAQDSELAHTTPRNCTIALARNPCAGIRSTAGSARILSTSRER